MSLCGVHSGRLRLLQALQRWLGYSEFGTCKGTRRTLFDKQDNFFREEDEWDAKKSVLLANAGKRACQDAADVVLGAQHGEVCPLHVAR